MRAESTIKPAKQFEIEEHNGIATIRFYQNVEQVERQNEDGQTAGAWAYDEYVLQVPAREGLEGQIEAHYDGWLALAIDQANKPKAETEKEIITRLESEINQLQAENAFLLLELVKGEL